MSKEERHRETIQRQAALQSLQLISNALAGSFVDRTPHEELELHNRREVARVERRKLEFQQQIQAKTWLCAYCGATHSPTIVELSENHRVILPDEACSCPGAQAEAARQAAAAAGQRLERHLNYLLTLPEWRDFDTEWPPVEAGRIQLRRAKQKVLEWYEGQEQHGLILTGGFGAGKSHLLRSVVRAFGFQGETVAFFNEGDIVSILTQNDSSSVEIARRCKTAKILVLDDIGSRQFNQSSLWAKHLLQSFYFQTLERRAEKEYSTLFSTNERFTELEPIMGPRAYDRLFAVVGGRDNVLSLGDVPSFRRKNF